MAEEVRQAAADRYTGVQFPLPAPTIIRRVYEEPKTRSYNWSYISSPDSRGGLIYWLKSQSIDGQEKLSKVIGNDIAKETEDDKDECCGFDGKD